MYDPKLFMNNINPQIIYLLNRLYDVKVRFGLECIMERVDMKSGNVTSSMSLFRNKDQIVKTRSAGLLDIYNTAVEDIMEMIANY